MESPVLLLLLAERLMVSVADGRPRSGLVVWGTRYDELPIGSPDLGFYDWLRDRAGSVVGVRLVLADEAAALRGLLPQWSYVVADSDYVVRVLFAEHAQIEDASVDQDFLYSRAFRSAEGLLLLA